MNILCDSQTTVLEQETLSSSFTAKLRQRKRTKPKNHKRSTLRLKKGSERKLFNASLWTLSENVAYVTFLAENSGLFHMSKIQRRDSKINVLMSLAIGTRSADQCRSHHQKMIKYHCDIPTIITHVLALRQNHQQNGTPRPPIQTKIAEPVLIDFSEEDRPFEGISFCEQLMNLT